MVIEPLGWYVVYLLWFLKCDTHSELSRATVLLALRSKKPSLEGAGICMHHCLSEQGVAGGLEGRTGLPALEPCTLSF